MSIHQSVNHGVFKKQARKLERCAILRWNLRTAENLHTHKIADRRAVKIRSEICVIVTAVKLAHSDHCRPQRRKNSKGLNPEKLFHHTSGFQRNKFGFLNIIWMFISDLAVRSDNTLYSFFNSSREAQYNEVRLVTTRSTAIGPFWYRHAKKATLPLWTILDSALMTCWE